MARKFVSPGVFTQELDQSYIATGVGAIGAVVIGRTAKGPGLKPTLVNDFNDFVAKFGDVDPTMQTPYAVKNYLKNAAIATVVRVLGDRTGAPDPSLVSNAATYRPVGIVDDDDTLLAVVNVPSGTSFTLTGASAYPTFSFSGSIGAQFTGVYSGTLSFLTSDADYIGNVLNTDPTKAYLFGHWLYKSFQWAHDAAASTFPYFTASISGALASTASGSNDNTFDTDFTYGQSPWVNSQKFGSQTYQLFRLWTMSAGEAANVDVKVSVANIKASVNPSVTKYGTFDIVVRAFQDTDGKLIQDETFTNVTLDPTAANYLPRVIGDQYRDWNATTQKLVTYGTYKNYSKFIRVEMATAATPPAEALPWGHAGYPEMMVSTTTINVPGATGTVAAVLSGTRSVTVVTTATGSQSYEVVFVSGGAESAALATYTATITAMGDITPTNFGDIRRLIGTLAGLSASGYATAGTSGTLVDLTLLPLTYTFAGVAQTYFTGNNVDVPYVPDNLDSNGNLAAYTYWGLDFSQDGVSDRLKFTGDGVYAPVGTAFSMHHLSASSSVDGVQYTLYTASFTGTIPSSDGIIGFTLGFYGGFDGFDETQVDPLAPTAPNAISTISLKKALDLIANPDEIDINLVAIPGITSGPVTSYAEQVCNARADAMYVMDISGSSVSSVISSLNTRGIDDNYTATYYPYLRYADTTNNVLVTVAPSVAVLGAIAYNDRVGQVFFAPAGLNRGGLAQFGIVDTVDRLTFQDRNDLYENRINPIATFPNEGIVIWGQKTLQIRASALDRVNVRRLLIYAKKTIASVARYLLFEPNNPQTWQRFLSTVNPILEKVRMDQGLERFKVVMDSTVNTPDLIDRNIMTGKIFLQPTRTAEYIDLSFIITSSGVQFEE